MNQGCSSELFRKSLVLRIDDAWLVAWRSSQVTRVNVKHLLVVLGLLLMACGTVPQSHGGPVQDQVSLIDALRKSATVDITGSIGHPFLPPDSGTTVKLDRKSVV